MNVDSEQITLNKCLVKDQDQPLTGKALLDSIINALDASKCKVITLPHGKKIVEFSDGEKTFHLLLRACTYLGNPHPVFKKRSQFPLWFNQYAATTAIKQPNIDVRYIGVYHYGNDFYGENLVFVDFKKDTFLKKKGHNSSAHVYTNDIFQAMSYGIFSKKDQFGNTITTIRKDKMCEYLSGKKASPNLFSLFEQFNNGLSFGQWLKALDAIKEMHENKWQQWRQAEWAGWFLEYKFNKFTIDNHITDQMRYVGSSLKHDGDLDFDIRFENDDFYGDLKASDIKKNEAPGNDQENLIECIQRYNKFWYVIYEHETIKDSSDTNYQASRQRNQYIKSVDPSYDKDELSYHQRMKSEVKFLKMKIIELNNINYREALTEFNQGHQPNGSARKPKFNINKNNIENFIVFRYTYNENI